MSYNKKSLNDIIYLLAATTSSSPMVAALAKTDWPTKTKTVRNSAMVMVFMVELLIFLQCPDLLKREKRDDMILIMSFFCEGLKNVM